MQNHTPLFFSLSYSAYGTSTYTKDKTKNYGKVLLTATQL